ncbi:MAG: HAMP domain-containing methyl-accepting chemotaxis protein [bacterium]|nr:HAMP domain-containing methyl-accepting chemotaxis protein [bacterium]
MHISRLKEFFRDYSPGGMVKVEDIKKRIFWSNIIILIFAVIFTNLMPTGNTGFRALFIFLVMIPCLALLWGVYHLLIKPSLDRIQASQDLSREVESQNQHRREQIVKIMAVVKEAAAGKLSQRVDIKSNDDMEKLGAGLNQMIDSLSELIEREKKIKASMQVSIVKLLELVKAVEKGDLTQQIVIDSNDEIGQIFTALNNLVQSLRHMVKELQQATNKVMVSGKELSTISHQSTSTISQVANTITQISSSLTQISQNAQAADSASQQTLTIARKGNDSIRNAIEGTKNTKTTVDDSAKIIRELGRRSTQIGEIITVITKVADQTNLLSLNAAIEAARAGEFGRGFAVVADEVRKLAEGSAQSASEISRLISEVQSETIKAVQAVERGANEVEEGVKLTEESAKAFKDIADSAKNMAEQVQSIAAATQETAAGAEEASASSQQQVASIEEITTSTVGLNEVANQLQEIVAKFKV